MLTFHTSAVVCFLSGNPSFLANFWIFTFIADTLGSLATLVHQ